MVKNIQHTKNLNQQLAVLLIHLCISLCMAVVCNTVLTIFPLILQTTVIAQTLSTGGERMPDE